ncbi:MAG: DNA polymerase III subunit delta [Oscillospiraceae bacterium]|jgi:DNA polymerase-3 subunit delta|nr:DNA polymerase III subunit delta [Oscillospiraceae bacterium]
MPNLTEMDLKQQLKSKNFASLYFLYGEEGYLTKYYTKELQKAVIGEQEGFNLHVFYGESLELDNLCEALETLPLLSQKKFIKILDLNLEKLDEKKFENVISNLPDTVVLAICQIDAEFNVKKSAKNSRFLKFLEKNGAVLKLEKLSSIALRRQLIFWAKRLDTFISENNAAKIVEKCGNNLSFLKHELCKICAFSGYSEVTAEMIDEVASFNLDTTVFVLIKAIMAKNYCEIYRQLDLLFSMKEEPIAILASIASSYVDFYRVKVAIESGKDILNLGKIFDYKGKMFRLDIAKRECKKISKKHIKNCLDIIAKTDYMLKSSKMNEKVLLEEVIVKISLIV